MTCAARPLHEPCGTAQQPWFSASPAQHWPILMDRCVPAPGVGGPRGAARGPGAGTRAGARVAGIARGREAGELPQGWWRTAPGAGARSGGRASRGGGLRTRGRGAGQRSSPRRCGSLKSLKLLEQLGQRASSFLAHIRSYVGASQPHGKMV